MMLRDEGKLDLGDPVSKYLPQLAQAPGRHREGPAQAVTLVLEPSKRDMTIQDLLRHTSGLTYGVFGTGAVKKLYTETGIDALDHTNAELVDKLGKLPLMPSPARRGSTAAHRRPRTRGRGGLGEDAQPVPGRAALPSAEDGRHRVLGARTASRRGSRRRWRAIPTRSSRSRSSTSRSRRSSKRAARRPCRPHWTTRASRRCSLNRGRIDGARLLSRKTVELMTAAGGLLSARRAGVELTIVCLNNDGGGIFDFLPVATSRRGERVRAAHRHPARRGPRHPGRAGGARAPSAATVRGAAGRRSHAGARGGAHGSPGQRRAPPRAVVGGQ